MRQRVLLIVLLVGNLALAIGWIVSSHRGNARLQEVLTSSGNIPGQSKTNVVVRRQFFSWQQVESDDYPNYVANLREIGCPEQTVRDIIVADVNAVYARKRASDIVTSDQQWWRSEPDSNVVLVATAKLRELEDERRALLTRLLGTNWETGDQINLPRPSRPGIILDGPVLGSLPNDVKQVVQEINIRAQDRTQAYIDAQQRAGKPVSEAELARLRQQTRIELAGVLAPAQLEEFLLRYSQNAISLRTELGQLKFFNATPDEFRAMFRAMDPITQQLDLLGDAKDAQTMSQRAALQAQADSVLKNVLGADRYELYRRLHEPGFRDAFAQAQGAGGTLEAASTIYQINQATAEEQARLKAYTNLTAQQLAVEMKRAELEQLKATAAALGQQVPPDPEPPPKPAPAKTHVLSRGENLQFLSRLYGVNPDQLRAANPNMNLDNLRAGDQVTVPINILPPVPALPPGLPQ
jgi:hypothetical protein